MQERNLLEDLVAVSPGMEIWWDSLAGHLRQLVQEDARQGGRAATAPTWSASSRACTTSATRWTSSSAASPPTRPSRWPRSRTTRRAGRRSPQKILADNPGLDTEGLFWLLYKEVVRQGSDMFLPLFEASGYKEGFLSGQVDPRSAFDGEAMLAQALEIHAVNPNVMVKVPGTAEGYPRHRGAHLARHRHQQHPHLRALAAAGLREVRDARPREGQGQRRRPLASGARSSPTWKPATATSAACVKPAPRRASRSPRATCAYAELAIFKKAYRTLKERDYQSKMLSCSLRLGPTVDGKQQHLAPRGEGRRRHRRHLPAVAHRRGHQLPASRGHQVQAEPDRRRSARRKSWTSS